MGRQKSSHPFNPSLSLSLFLSSFFPPLGLALFHRYSRSTSGKLIAAAYKAYHPSSSSSSLFPPSSSFPSLPALRLFSPFYLLFFFFGKLDERYREGFLGFFFFFFFWFCFIFVWQLGSFSYFLILGMLEFFFSTVLRWLRYFREIRSLGIGMGCNYCEERI